MHTEPIVVGQGTAYPLKGLLTLPAHTDGPVPAVVFVHGSGSSNMDEKVGKLTPFRDLAEGLARHGIASIRYDKRSFAHGFRMVMNKKVPITVKEETMEDAILATALLRQDSRIDPDRIYLVGHSMGGMLAPRIDAEGGNYRGLILMAGSTRKLEEIMVEQNNEVLADQKGLVRKLLEGQIGKLNRLFDGLYDLTDEEAKQKKVGGGTTLYYFKEMGSHPPADYLRALEKPILVMQGGKDFQVRADKDFAAYRELLNGKPNAAFRLYPNLNHAFVPAIYTDIAKAKQEYNVERHIGEDVIADLAGWILETSGR